MSEERKEVPSEVEQMVEDCTEEQIREWLSQSAKEYNAMPQKKRDRIPFYRFDVNYVLERYKEYKEQNGRR